MKHHCLFLIALLLGSFRSNAQEAFNLLPLSKADADRLKAIPEWSFNPAFRRVSLPPIVDNSATPYMRPLVAQVGLECGQASSIGIMFTYEINAKRKVPGNLPENQYATHFTYNFLNGGSNAGINYFESFEIVKYAGNPSVATYGGMAAGGASRWMDGYQNYLAAMKNRIENVYSINTSTVEGILKAKHWIFDHGNGSENGGMLSFYSQFTNPPNTFPQGVPEAGKHVIVSWGSNPDHAMTIVGYNDSIRWDYNGDGQYTNHIDLNGDGIIDARDWEIGGFKMANTYGSISGWGDQGFAYMMYKTVADAAGNGGIWNNQLVIAEVKESYMPALTAKVGLTYPCRNKLKIMAGIATDLQSNVPEFDLLFPMFDFQGGCLPMQGNGASATIEIGLDLTPLLQYVPSGTPAKYFLSVIEDDPNAGHSGQINYFALIDYTGLGATEIPYPQTNVPIQHNNTTHLGLVATIQQPVVSINSSNLPAVNLYTPQQIPLTAQGGKAPYYWYPTFGTEVSHGQALFPMDFGSQLQVTSNSSGYATLQLPFEFPFYGEKFNVIYPTVDGFIMFEPSLLPWPYYIAGRTYLIQNKMIAPALSKPFQLSGNQDGIWATLTDSTATITWRLSVYGQNGNGQVLMASTLHKNGKIEFFYGNFNVASFVARFAGISAGDGINHVAIHGPGFFTPQPQQHTTFVPAHHHPDIRLSRQGLLNLVLNDFTDSIAVPLLVRDQNSISDRKTIYLHPQGLVMNYQLEPAVKNQLIYGDTVLMHVQLININPFTISNALLSLQLDDPYISLAQTQLTVPSMAPGDTLNLHSAFTLYASLQAPDQHQVFAQLKHLSLDGDWTRPLTLTTLAPMPVVKAVQVNDGQNSILEPGETASLLIHLKNEGHAPLETLQILLATQDQYLNIIEGTANLPLIMAGQSATITFVVQLSNAAPPQHIIEFVLQLQSANGYQRQLYFPLITSIAIESFESGGFDMFNWEHAGDAPWVVTNQQAFEGNYCAKSGNIGHNAFSELKLSYNVAFADSISFYYKISSENNYDFLKFFVGANQKAQWSGEKPWTRASFAVPPGQTTFRWRYAKDFSVVAGSDCAWIDYIVLPAFMVYTSLESPKLPTMAVFPNPSHLFLTICINDSQYSNWHIALFDVKGNLMNRLQHLLTAGSPLQIDMSDLPAGIYQLRATDGKTLISKTIIKM